MSNLYVNEKKIPIPPEAFLTFASRSSIGLSHEANDYISVRHRDENNKNNETISGKLISGKKGKYTL